MASSAAVMAVVRAARPQFRHRADALAFALHAALLAEGFVLVAAGAAAEAEPDAGAPLRETGHDGWNTAADEYAFRYRREGGGVAHQGTSVLKALAANGKLFVDAAPPSPGAPAHLELSVNDYTTGQLGDSYADVFSNVEGLLSRVRAALLPALKPEAAPRREAAEAPGRAGGRGGAEPEPEPVYGGGYGGGYGGARGGRGPGILGGVGAEDLYPPGMPWLPPLGPMQPPGGHGGGMLVGPDHPAFFPGGGAPGHPPQLPPGVPPGARYDPYGPPGVPGFEPDRFGGERGRGQGGPVFPGQQPPPQQPPVHPDVMPLGGGDDAHLFL